MAAQFPSPAVSADSLTMAVIKFSNAPLLLLDGNLRVVAASMSFCKAFEIELEAANGTKLADLGGGEWNMPKLMSLLNSTLSWRVQVPAYELDFVREDKPTRQLVINASKLDHADGANACLLLTINDVTDSRRMERAKDQRLHSKAIMLQELQHRVANSLQIIASVLMQSARAVQSEESRTHLTDAHHRVLSVGDMQQHLNAGGQGVVELRGYFTQLCASIGASMISDPNRIVLNVKADETWLDAEDAISLGLIVTELTINALKHAFKANMSGTIVVEYRVSPSLGTLSICDNGVGIKVGMLGSKPGLGTSIVEALANQLGGKVIVSNNNPGTCVTVVNHRAQLEEPVAA